MAVEFILVATNLNDGSNTNTESGISEQNRILTVEDTTSCDVYSFQVTARNAAGSNSSDNITSSFPSLPDISQVEDSSQHSLVKTTAGISLTVTLHIAMQCPDYPVHNYTLVVNNGNWSLSTTQTSQATSGAQVKLVVEALMENSQFTYYVKATNRFGDSNSSNSTELCEYP